MQIFTYQVKAKDVGMRLDRFVAKYQEGMSFVAVQKMARKGDVRVDGKRAKAGDRLDEGAEVVVKLSNSWQPKVVSPKEKTSKIVTKALIKRLKDAVLYDDDDIVVFDKPPGLATQGGSGITESVDAGLGAFALRSHGNERPKLVHRLDKDTSGLLLVARHSMMARRLTEAFAKHKVKKTYWACVVGIPKQRSGVIEAPIAKIRSGKQEKMVVDPDGQSAVTHYRVLATDKQKRLSWLELSPQTGRTHQLRVHCASLGTPILGDGKYGGKKAFVDGFDPVLHLHAREIALPDDIAIFCSLQAPLPPHMVTTWNCLGF